LTESEFKADPGLALHDAQSGPVEIVDREGAAIAVLSVPRDVRPVPAAVGVRAASACRHWTAAAIVVGNTRSFVWCERPGSTHAGDPIGYVRGHVSREQCIASALAGGFAGPEKDDPSSIWHGYLRTVPNTGDRSEFDRRWVACGCPGPGAFAVTFWDQTGGVPWNAAWTDAPMHYEA
jgi:hypothetical protein